MTKDEDKAWSAFTVAPNPREVRPPSDRGRAIQDGLFISITPKKSRLLIAQEDFSQMSFAIRSKPNTHCAL